MAYEVTSTPVDKVVLERMKGPLNWIRFFSVAASIWSNCCCYLCDIKLVKCLLYHHNVIVLIYKYVVCARSGVHFVIAQECSIGNKVQNLSTVNCDMYKQILEILGKDIFSWEWIARPTLAPWNRKRGSVIRPKIDKSTTSLLSFVPIIDPRPTPLFLSSFPPFL